MYLRKLRGKRYSALRLGYLVGNTIIDLGASLGVTGSGE